MEDLLQQYQTQANVLEGRVVQLQEKLTVARGQEALDILRRITAVQEEVAEIDYSIHEILKYLG